MVANRREEHVSAEHVVRSEHVRRLLLAGHFGDSSGADDGAAHRRRRADLLPAGLHAVSGAPGSQFAGGSSRGVFHPWWSFARSQAYTNWLRRWGTTVIGVTVVAFVLALGGMRLLRAESHVLELFAPGDRIPVNYHAIEDHLIGLTPFELVVEGDSKVLLTDATLESYRALLEETLAEEPLIREVVSIVLEPTRGRKLEFALQPAELREALATEGLPQGAGAFLKAENGRYMLRTHAPFGHNTLQTPVRQWWSGYGHASRSAFHRAFRRM